MRINTKAYGSVELDDRQILFFPHGVIGFEQFKNYALLDAAQQPFYWLQSLDMEEIAFVLISPSVFRPDYTPDVAPEDMAELSAEDPGDLLVFAIVTIPENQNRMTANLQGPVLINRKTRTGRQSISLNQKWQLKHFIMDELAALQG
ncbi:MAG: flagellar assembly protein FliW [Spirochaetales bacterium]|jgi:flagellar assembly factor FliW|nr:flagellar assembly protein FliW [Spirochaetales bacterium]